MPLRSRSILFAVLTFLSATYGLAQPAPTTQTSDVERLRTAYDQRDAGSYTRSLRTLEPLLDPHRLTSWDPLARLTRVELMSTLQPRHNPDRDLATFVDAFASSPQAPYAHIRRGIAALQRGQNGQARVHFDEAVRTSAEQDPEQIDDVAAGTAFYWLGIAHLTDRDGALHAQATDALRTSIDEYPRNPFADDACFALGQLYEERGELDSAIAFYNRLVERYPTSENRLEAALRAAQSHLRLGRVDAARRILADVRSEITRPSADPERTALHTAEYHLLDAVAEERAGDFAAAERSYLTVVYSLDSPYRRSAMLGLADTYRSAGRNDSATSIYRRIVAENRRDLAGMSAEFELAIVPLAPPYPAESLRPLEAIAADSAHQLASSARVTLAGIHYLRQDFAAADAILDSALDRIASPALLVRGTMLRGAVALATARYREADEDFTRALRVLHETPAVLLPERDSLLGSVSLLASIAMIHAGRPSDAVPQLNRLLETQPSNAAEATYWLGEAYYAAGVLPAAVQTMEDMIERYPSSQRIEDALYLIGWAQFKQRKLDRAEAAFGRLVKAYPLTAYATGAYLRRGDCLYLMRKYAAAAESYDLVDTLAASPDLVEYARYQSALASYHAEKRDTAGFEFKRFVALYPHSDLADDAMFMAGLVDYLERRYPDAVLDFTQLANSTPDSPLLPRARTTLAQAYYALGELDSSRANAARVVADAPQSSYRDEAAAALERADAAIRERDRQRAREAQRTDEAFAHARSLRESGSFDDAIAEYQRVQTRALDEQTSTRAIAEIARCRILSGDTLAALASLREAATHSSTSAGRAALWELADHFRTRHEADSAALYYTRLAALSDSTAPLAHLRLGQAYLGNERWTSALDQFTLVLSSHDAARQWLGEANLGMAQAHVGQGDRQRAREIFERLVREHAGDDISRRAEEQLRALGNL
jgi:TolA-binding protein